MRVESWVSWHIKTSEAERRDTFLVPSFESLYRLIQYMKKLSKRKKLLLEAYRMGQESVTFMKIIPSGKVKWMGAETSTTEDEMLEKLLTNNT